MSKKDTDAFTSMVRKTWDAWARSMVDADAAGWVALWEDDAVQMVPNARARHGKTALLEGFKESLRGGKYEDVTIDLEEAVSDGTIGYARGNGTYIFVRADGHRVPVDAKYLTIFRKQNDGTWKVHIDCVNLNTAAGG